jgi:hypothetical protein
MFGGEAEGGWIPDLATNGIERASNEFQRHKSLRRKGGFEVARGLGSEAEALVILGMPEDEDDVFAARSHRIDAAGDQSAGDALALVFGEDGYGGQGDCGHGLNPDAAEQYVPDDSLFAFGHQRSEDDVVCAQGVDEIGLVRPAKRVLIDRSDGRAISRIVRVFETYEHVLEVRQWVFGGPGRLPTVKIHLNRFSIWMEGDKPCCSPGSSDEKVAEVLDFIRVADEWITAVQEQQAAQRKAQLVSK